MRTTYAMVAALVVRRRQLEVLSAGMGKNELGAGLGTGLSVSPGTGMGLRSGTGTVSRLSYLSGTSYES